MHAPAVKGLKRLTRILGMWLVEMVISTNHMLKTFDNTVPESRSVAPEFTL